MLLSKTIQVNKGGTVASIFNISNEDQAWELLENWLNDREIGVVAFDGWPRLAVSIKGEDYSSSLSSHQMAALLHFKRTMDRAYSALAHGSYDARRLKKHEEEKLDFTTTVKKGSSITDTDLTPLVNAIAQIVTNHPNATIAAAVILGLTFAARSLVLKHLDNKAKQIDANERLKLVGLSQATSENDRARWELMDRAIAKIAPSFPQFPQLVPDASTAYWQLAGSAANADHMNISGVELSRVELEILSERRLTRDATVETLIGKFSVLGIVKIHKNYRIQLKSDTVHLSAIYGAPEMNDGKVKKLMTAMTSSQLIDATIEIKTVDKSQVIGRLLSFSVVKAEDARVGN